MVKRRNTTILITFFIVAIIALLIINPSRYIQSAYNGIILFGTAVLPALFPFFFFSKILTSIGTANILSCFMRSPIRLIYRTPPGSSYILIMSLISGYPIGASLTAIYHEQGYITSAEARSITSFCSTSGSLFIVGTVAVQMFHNKNYGYILLGAHYLGALINGLLFRARLVDNARKHRLKRFGACPVSACNAKDCKNCQSLSECMRSFAPPVNRAVSDSVISDAISNSVTSILIVGGYISIFSIIIDVCYDIKLVSLLVEFMGLLRIPEGIAETMVVGLIEITRGCLSASSLSYSPVIVLPITCAMISFGGTAIAMQSITFLSKCNVTLGQYLLRKFTQALISAALCLLICLAVYG